MSENRRALLGQFAMGATFGLAGPLSRSAAWGSVGDEASSPSQSTSGVP